MATLVPFTSRHAPAQSYNPSEWEEKREIITALYSDKAKRLADVLRILAQEHSFYPT